MGRGRSIVVAVAGAVFLLATLGVHAVDRELTSDFIVPDDQVANATFFTSYLLKDAKVNNSRFATVTNANLDKGFKALDSLGVSTTLLQFPPGTVNKPHTHPRGTEVLFIIEGTLDVGLVIQEGTDNKLITKTLTKGDLFVFPRGLVHFQINWGQDGKSVTAVGSFSSSNAGTIILPPTLFGSKLPINDDVLAKSFGVSVDIRGGQIS